MKIRKKISACVAVFMCICILFSSCKKPLNDGDTSSDIENPPIENEYPSASRYFTDIRGLWVSSVLNIDFPSKDNLTSQQMKSEIDDIISLCLDTGINTVFFQVRPSCDALYKSEIFPTSIYLSGTQGAPLPDGFDPLEYMIEQAHKRKIAVHAWINPYRVTGNMDMSLDELSPDNPALKNREQLVLHKGKYYLDPSLESSIQLIVDGVKEIVENYNIDGIHFDDYFYPDKDFDDDSSFAPYSSKYESKHEWRCENVNNMLSRVYSSIKETDKTVIFGVSPMGIWANKSTDKRGSDTKGGESLISHCADSLAWIEKGIIDYICPQLYWTNKSTISNFDILVDWWENAVKDSNVKLIIGHALYKFGDENYPDFDSAEVITNQLEKSIGCSGNVFYNYSSLKKNTLKIKDAIKEYYAKKADFSSLKVAYPEKNMSVTTDTIRVLGTYNPLLSLTVNGKEIKEKNINGLFSTVIDLSLGENTITVKNGDEEQKVIITRKKPKTTATQLSDCYPDDHNAIRYSGDTLEIKVSAPENASVTATVNKKNIILEADKENKTLYKGKYQLPETDTKLNLGKVKYTAVLSDGKALTKTAKTDITLLPSSEIKVARLKAKSWLRPHSVIKNFRDSFYGYEGLVGKITAEDYFYDAKTEKKDTFVRFENGLWTQKSNIEIIEAEKEIFPVNEISVSCEEKYTVFTFQGTPLPIKAVNSENTIVLQLIGQSPVCQDISFKENPLFSKAELKDGKIELTLKNKNAFFGFKIENHDTSFKILFKNPVKIKDRSNPLQDIVIALDPGHGAVAGATAADANNEREINFKTVMELKEILEAKGARVFVSRQEKSNGLETREVVDFYDTVSPDLAVSIHHNAVGEGAEPIDDIGFECYYSSFESKAAAETVFKGISKNTKIPSTLEDVDYIVTRTRAYPSILLEMGYITNIYEYTLLNNKNYRTLFLESIASCITEYFIWQNSL
ncbi:MAG: hypothetical protein E7480_00555 [Ruminococcaceae bacterium]|nr:hypothetical protein [Oscillospiraceae bacterium]